MVPLGAELTLNKLAEMDDSILELATPTIGAVQVPPSPQPSHEVQALSRGTPPVDRSLCGSCVLVCSLSRVQTSLS